MTLHAKYSPEEDRMRLIVQSTDADSRAFWFTRQQWIELIFRLLPLVHSQGQGSTARENHRGKNPNLAGNESTVIALKSMSLRPLPMLELFVASFPFLIIMLAWLMLITYLPQLSLWWK